MQSTMMVGVVGALWAVSLGGGTAAASPRCAHLCADDIRACVAIVNATHPCGDLAPSAAKQCRTERRASRRACRELRAACTSGRKVCSGQ